MSKQTVFIIGAGGRVGSTAAHSLAIKEVVHDIVLIDVDQKLAHGHAMDINHAAAYTNGVHVRTGGYSQIKADDIIIISAGISQAPGQTRLELLDTNVKIVRDIVKKVMSVGQPVYILMVSNPVDILTAVVLKESGLPKERVFGSGTTLDTARLRVTLAHQLHVSQQEVEAYVLGEHGNSSFPALSNATIAGIPLAKFPGFMPETLETIGQDIRDSVYKIIDAKKHTYHGIGHVIAKIVEAMQRDRPTILPVCSLAEGEYGLNDVVIGLPSLVSRQGVRILDNYPLDKNETKLLHASAQILKDAAKGL